jgi:hypothetical protein
MSNKVFTVLLAAIVVAGCSSAPPPVVRKPGSFTSITFPVMTDLWADGKVQLATKNKNGCGELSDNIIPATFESDLAFEIEGNRDFFFRVARTDAQGVCDKVGIFYAAKGNEYTFNLSTKNNQCEISLTEKTPNGIQKAIKSYPAHVSAVDGKKVCENKDRLY